MADIKIIADKEDIVAIADAVRNKTGNTEEMTLSEIVIGINGIQLGSGVNVSFNNGFSVTDDGEGNITIINNEGV